MVQLVSLDWLGDPEQLRAQALAEVRAAGRTGQPAQLRGSDSSSLVTVEVDAHRRVVDVGVSLRWRSGIQPVRLGPALYEAYGKAMTVALEALVARSVTGGALEEDDAGPVPDALRFEDGEDWLSSVEDTIARASARLDASRWIETGDPPQVPETEVRSPDWMFTMRRRGRTVIGIISDPLRIQETTADRIREDALGLFRAAELTR
jgi:hypothetical protein